MNNLTKLSLFSGIGGDDLASDWAGIQTIAFVERDKFCQSVLRKHWPGIPIIGDVHEVTKESIAAVMDDTKGGRCGFRASKDIGQVGRNEHTFGDTSDLRSVDIISGGFPCQPHSVAGKRKAASDERDLWPEFRRIIGEIRPRWVVAENVPGLLSSDAGRFFGAVLSDLAALGYSVGWCTFGAVDVGAWHRRDRVFIVAHAELTTSGRGRVLGAMPDGRRTAPPTESAGLQSRDWQAHSGDTESSGSTLSHSTQREDNRRERGDMVGEAEGRQSSNAAAESGREDVADTFQSRLEGRELLPKCAGQLTSRQSRLADPQCQQLNGQGRTRGRWSESPDGSGWATEPNVDRVAHGIRHRVDRLRALGNAVVPQQIYPIYKAIVEASR